MLLCKAQGDHVDFIDLKAGKHYGLLSLYRSDDQDIVNKQDKLGNTALHYAYEVGNEKIIEFLKSDDGDGYIGTSHYGKTKIKTADLTIENTKDERPENGLARAPKRPPKRPKRPARPTKRKKPMVMGIQMPGMGTKKIETEEEEEYKKITPPKRPKKPARPPKRTVKKPVSERIKRLQMGIRLPGMGPQETEPEDEPKKDVTKDDVDVSTSAGEEERTRHEKLSVEKKSGAKIKRRRRRRRAKIDISSALEEKD